MHVSFLNQVGMASALLRSIALCRGSEWMTREITRTGAYSLGVLLDHSILKTREKVPCNPPLKIMRRISGCAVLLACLL